MKITILLVVMATFCVIPILESAPAQEDARELNNEPEIEERRHRRKKRPCGRDAGGGRTLFDWNYSYVNVNYNYNCGGSGGGGGGHVPIFGGGGGHKPILGGGGGHKPILGGSLGGQKPPILGGGLGGQKPPLLGGVLGGQKPPILGGSFGNKPIGALAGSISNYPTGGHYEGSQGGGGNHGGGGLFGLGLFDWLTNQQSSKPERPPPTQQPNFEVEKPVYENYDDVVPEGYQNLRPGQYVAVSNPIFGSYAQDITNFNPNKIIRQVNREVASFFKPLYDLLRR